MLAGVLIWPPSAPAAVFVLNAVLAGVAFVLILRWRGEPRAPARCPASASSAPCARACNFACAVAAAEGRCCCASSCSSCSPRALVALLPLVARGLHGGGAGHLHA
ncbi:MAG: hypothetical protein MZW92_49100 [Comamonadaceae bacterium]|nr:hypothetical protein [Comamonadaceae bacterium]